MVNGEAITTMDLQKRILAQIHQSGGTPTEALMHSMTEETLESMINDILLRQEASRLKVTISDQDLNRQIASIRENMGNISMAEFEKEIAKQSLTLDDVKEQLRNNGLRQRIINFMISRKVVVTQDEIERYYEENRQNFATGREADFSLIVFPPNFDAKTMYQNLKNGSINFEATAKQYSLDPSAQNGGRVGRVAWGAMTDNMRMLLNSLQPGQLSELIPFQGANVVVRLNRIIDGDSVTLEDVRDQIEARIKEPRLQERYIEYTEQLRKRAVVDIRL